MKKTTTYKKIVKDRFGRLAPEPDFNPCPVFYRIAPSSHTIEEGERWEFEILEETATGKKDRRGRNILTSLVTPVKRLEDIYKQTISFDKEKSCFIVPVYSGDKVVNKLYIKADIKKIFSDINTPEVGMVYLIAEGQGKIEADNDTFIPSETIDRISMMDIKEGKIPSWINEEETKRILEAFEKREKAREERKKQEEERQRKISELLSEATIENTTIEDLLKKFIENGGHIVNPEPATHNDYLYGQSESVFDINGFRFKLEYNVYDSDYVEIESIKTKKGEIRDKEMIDTLLQLARFIANPDKNVENFIDRAKFFVTPPKDEVLFAKEIHVGYEAGRFSQPGHSKFDRMDDEKIKQIKETLSKEVESFLSGYTLPKPITNNLYDIVNVTYNPEIKTEIKEVTDTEEGVGKKENSYWSNTKIVATVSLTWKEEIK